MKSFAVVLILILCCAALLTLISPLFAFIDLGLIDNIDESKGHDGLSEHTDVTDQNLPCLWAGCNEMATKEFVLKVDSKAKRHESLNIPNPMNCRITKYLEEDYDTKTYTTKDKYKEVSYEGNGNFAVRDKTKKVEHTYIENNGYIYVTTMAGQFCSTHHESGLKLMKEEFKEGIYRSNFFARLSAVLVPLIHIILAIIGLLVGLACAERGEEGYNNGKRNIITGLIFTSICVALSIYGKEGGYLKLFGVFGSAFFGMWLTTSLGQLIASLVDKKKNGWETVSE